jgi:hypothetical protein
MGKLQGIKLASLIHKLEEAWNSSNQRDIFYSLPYDAVT